LADQNFRVKNGIGIGTYSFVDINRNVNAGVTTLGHLRVTGITTVGIISAIDGNGAQGIVTFQSRIGIHSNGKQVVISSPSTGAGYDNSYELILPPRPGSDGQTLTIGQNGQLGFTTAGLYEARFYVSSANGDDTNDGRAKPVATIKKAAQLASFRSFVLPGGRYLDAGNLLELNNNFIKEEVVGFVTFTYPSLLSNQDYDATTCKRDVGYVVDAIVYDLSYGGNSKSVQAGLSYWNAGTSYVAGESVETIAAYRYIIDLSKKIINNVAVTTSYQSPAFTVSQTFDNTIAYDASCSPSAYSENCCANVQAAIGSYVGIITSIIGIGTTAAPATTLPSTKSRPVAIFVEAGEYVEDNPIILYEDIAIVGDNLRNTIIRPSNAGKDLFRVRNGCYVTGFAMKDYVDPAGIPQFAFDNAVAFDDPTDSGTSRAGYATKTTKPIISRSPYIQNCSILSFLGANGIFVDGNKVTTPNTTVIPQESEIPVIGAQPQFGKSMVAAAFTMVSFGGIGWRCINEGYAQVVSCFQIFCRYGSLTQSGGYLSITNSATNFGLYALRSTGWCPTSFAFDRGRVAATGISGGLQTLKVVGVGRTDQDLYVLRFYNNAVSDQTANFKPVVTQQTFNATSGINTSSDTFLIASHPFINGDTVLYIGDEGANPPKVIGGLVSSNQYYLSYIDTNSFKLYEDSSLTRIVDLTSGVVGIHTFQKGNLEFFVKEMLDTHNSYQVLGIGSTANPLNFVSGRQITQSVTGGTAVGYAVTYRPNVGQNGQLLVSVESSGGVRRFFAPTGSTSLTYAIQDHSGSPVSVAVTSVVGISTYYTLDFKLDSTPSGITVTNIANLPETYNIQFHRPSIINSSGHTWEYSGSGIDYNALPQNGGKTDTRTEQIFELGGRVYSSGTNELGDFKIGSFITAFNRTGNIVFNNKVSIGVLESLRLSLSGGVAVEEFSTDVTLGDSEVGGPKNTRVSTQLAVKSFLNTRLGNFIDKNVSTNAIPSSVVQLNSIGQINADLIPPKVVNYYRANVSGGRTDLVNQIPATNLQNGDTVIEPGNGYVLISDVYSQYLILSDTTRNYNFNNADTVISTVSNGGAIGIVTAPPVNAVGYGTTGLVKGVLLGVSISNGGSGYTSPGIYTCFLDTATGIGTSARATITVGGGGTVTSVNINFGGRRYVSGNTLTVNNDSFIGGRTGGAQFQASVNSIETRLYLKLTNNQKFTGSSLITDYVSDNDAVAISTNTSVGYGKTFIPTDTSTGGSIDFANDRIIIGVSTFTNADPVIYSANGGNVIGGLTQAATYYIKRVGISSVELYTTFALSSKLDLTSSGTGTATITRVGVNTDVSLIAFERHGLGIGDAVKVSGSTPTGITTDSYYYVGVAVTNAFSLHTTRTDSLASVNGLILNAVGLANTNGGTFTLTKQNVIYSATINTSSNISDNWTVLASGTIDASNISSGTVSPSRLGSGSATNDTFLAGDSSFKKVVTSVGIGTTQPIQATASSFDSAPGGIGINTYYGKVNITINRAAGTGDLYSTLGVAKFKTSTFSVDADGAVSIKPSTSGDVDASTLGGQAGSYYLDPVNLTGSIPISKGGTGLGAAPSLGAILQGNGLTYDLVTTPTFGGNVTITNNGRLFAIGIAATNISVEGVTGIATFQNFKVTNEVISGVSTFSGSGNNINQTAGTAALNRLTVTGVTTVSTLFFESLGGTAGATIPYIQNVNTVHTGIVTFSSSGNNIKQTAGTAELNNLSVSGVSTFVSIVNFGIANFGTVDVTGTLSQLNGTVSGVSTFSGSGNNINQTNGTAALNRLTVAGVSTVARLVQSSNETSALQRLTVAGISTFTGQLNAGTISASSLIGTLNNTLTFSSPLTGTSYNNSGAVTLGINATSANTASYVVQRGASGEFSMGALTASTGSFSSTVSTNGGKIYLRDDSIEDFTTNGNSNIAINYAGYQSGFTQFRDFKVWNGKAGLVFAVTGSTGASNFYGTVTSSSTITGTQLISNIATGTAPLTVASTTQVSNLNASYLQGYQTATANTINSIVLRDGSGNFSAGTITANLTGNAATATTHVVTDSRNAVTTPQTINMGVVFDFKANATEGLSDGGTYFGEMTFRQYGASSDWSGGSSHQLGFTDNGNIWQRTGSTTVWGAWKRLLDSSNYNSYAPTLTGTGASGTWGISVTGNAATATVATSSSRLYSTDSQYAYGSANPYYGYLTYDGSRWLLQVSPGTPASVRVAYSDNSGLLGGLALNTSGRADVANQVVRTDGSGYIQAGWINSTSGDMGDWGNGVTRYYTSNDGYIRYNTRNSTKVQLGLTGKYDADRRDFTSDSNYFTGSMGWGTEDFNNVMTWGSGFFDTWSNPANQPSGTSHWVGVQAYHYVNAANSGYGWQMCGGPIANLRFRNSWPNNTSWKTIPVLDVNDTNGGAMYAGLYYDSNNTGYYTDPASTSILNNLTLNGSLTVGSSTSSDIYMTDTDEGTRRIHCNSNRIGFLNQDAGWGAYCSDNGDWTTDYISYAGASHRSPIFYDSNNTAYYVDPNVSTFIRGQLGVQGGHGNTQIRLTTNGPELGSGQTSAMTWWISEPGITWNEGGFGYNVTNDNGSPGGFGRLNAGYGQAYMRFSTGGNLYFYNTNTSGTRYTNMELYADNTVYINNYATGGNSLRAPIFYDSNNTGYYCDPASYSQFSSGEFNSYIRAARLSFIGEGGNSGQGVNAYSIFQEGGGWSYPYPDLRIAFHTGIKLGANAGSYEGTRVYSDYDMSTLIIQLAGSSNYIFKYNWMYTNTTGIYSDSHSAHIYPNSGSTYTQWRIDGNKNGYGGIYDSHSAVNIGMYDGSGNGGVYREANGRWIFYHLIGHNCMGVNTSTTSGSYGMYVSGGIYSTGNVVAYSDARKKTNIQTIAKALDKVLQLRGVTFNKFDIDNVSHKKLEMGVIAQEVELIVPEVVTYAEDIDEYGVSYGNFAGLFIEAFKEQNELINMLRKEVEELKFKLGD